MEESPVKVKSIYRINYWDCLCGFRSTRSTTDQTFCIHQTVVKKWQYNGEQLQLFTDLEKAYNSVMRKKSCNIFNDCRVPMKQTTLIKMDLVVSHSNIRICYLKRMKLVGIWHIFIYIYRGEEKCIQGFGG